MGYVTWPISKALGGYDAQAAPYSRTPLYLCPFPCTNASCLELLRPVSFNVSFSQCFSARGCEGITPEQFWANSERLVDLANSGDRSAFEGVIAALLTRNKKTNAGSASGGSAERRHEGGARDGGAPTRGDNISIAEGSGHDRIQEPWQPVGPELHAVLGATGGEAGVGSQNGAQYALASLHSSLPRTHCENAPLFEGPNQAYIHMISRHVQHT